MDIDYGAIITVLAGLWLPGIITFLVGCVFVAAKTVWNTLSVFIKSHLTLSQQAVLANIAKEAVFAAEQIANREDVKNAAEAKREIAFNYINNALGAKHIALTAQQIYSLIEASVYENLNQWKDKPAPVAVETTPPVATFTVSEGAVIGGGTPATVA